MFRNWVSVFTASLCTSRFVLIVATLISVTLLAPGSVSGYAQGEPIVQQVKMDCVGYLAYPLEFLANDCASTFWISQ